MPSHTQPVPLQRLVLGTGQTTRGRGSDDFETLAATCLRTWPFVWHWSFRSMPVIALVPSYI
jgi:hypothetical protein